MSTSGAIAEGKQKLAKAYNAFHAIGFFDYGGDVSLRLEDGRFLIRSARVHVKAETPGSKVRTYPENVLLLDSEGQIVDGVGIAPLEVITHVALYKARPELRSVLHAHARMATVVSIVEETVMPCHIRGVETTSDDRLAYLDVSDGISTPGLASMLVETMGERQGALLRSHGIVTVGPSLETACNAGINLEEAARMYWMARAIGTPRPLPPENLARRRATWENPIFASSVWQYFEELGELATSPAATSTRDD